MDSFNKENEDPSLSSSESNLPQTVPPSKWHKLTTGIWLGGSLIIIFISNMWMTLPRAIDNVEMGTPIAWTYSSHTHVTPHDVHPFCLSPILFSQLMTFWKFFF